MTEDIQSKEGFGLINTNIICCYIVIILLIILLINIKQTYIKLAYFLLLILIIYSKYKHLK